MKIEDLIHQSGAVFIGTVRTSDPSCPGGRKPCTRVTFAEVELVAGRLPQAELTFLLPEGQLDDGTTLRISGAPQFRPGQRYLVFVRAGEWFNTPVTNWFHSVFREIKLGKLSVFVSYDGRAVQRVSEQGFRLGETVAPPEELLSPQAPDSPGDPIRGRMGAMSSERPQVSDKVREAFARPDTDWTTLAMPKEDLIRQIQEFSRRYKIAEDEPIRLTPSKAGPPGSQASPTSAAGLGPAVPEREGQSPNLDRPRDWEPPGGLRSNPGHGKSD